MDGLQLEALLRRQGQELLREHVGREPGRRLRERRRQDQEGPVRRQRRRALRVRAERVGQDLHRLRHGRRQEQEQLVLPRDAPQLLGHPPAPGLGHLPGPEGRLEGDDEVLPERRRDGAGPRLAPGDGEGLQGGHAQGPGRLHGHPVVPEHRAEQLGDLRKAFIAANARKAIAPTQFNPQSTWPLHHDHRGADAGRAGPVDQKKGAGLRLRPRGHGAGGRHLLRELRERADGRRHDGQSWSGPTRTRPRRRSCGPRARRSTCRSRRWPCSS